MDQNYDYYGNRPERPLTEKDGGVPPQNAEHPGQGFQPENPLTQNAQQPVQSGDRWQNSQRDGGAAAGDPGYPQTGFQPEKPLMQNALRPSYGGEERRENTEENANAPVNARPETEYPRGEYGEAPRGYMYGEYREPPREQPRYPYPPSNAYPPREGMPPRNAPQSDFDPVRHTATYQDGAFSAPQNASPRENRPYPSNNDFSQQSYYNPAMDRADYPGNYPARDGYGMEARPKSQPPAPAPDGNPYEYRQRQAYDNPPALPTNRGKSNKGLIAVIIVLAVLLAGSLGGILIYVLNNSAPEKRGPENPTNSPFYNIPDFTYPNMDQTDPPVHNESDYSDQTVKDYEGLVLEKKPADASTNDGYKPDYSFKKVSDSIIGVLCYSNEEQLTASSQGSGIIISEDGYAITNAHVIGNSKTAYSIKVVDSSGKEYTAGVVGFDVRTDLAVIKLDGAKNLAPATFGDSSETVVGEDIIIVGNPGGLNYKNSMTKGVVSALDRDASKKSIVKYIQTDAAINPGNSGGPAVNMYGQVIGVASAKIVDSRYEGMGFCIPSATVKDVIDSLMKNSYVEGRVKIGITGIAVSDLEQNAGLPSGIYISEIEKNGPCDGTELESEDIITSADGEAITSFSDIYNVLEGHKAGDKIKLEYYRYSDNSKGEVEITLAEDKN